MGQKAAPEFRIRDRGDPKENGWGAPKRTKKKERGITGKISRGQGMVRLEEARGP